MSDNGWTFDFSDSAPPPTAEQRQAAVRAIGAALRLGGDTSECDQFDAWVRDTLGPEYVALVVDDDD